MKAIKLNFSDFFNSLLSGKTNYLARPVSYFILCLVFLRLFLSILRIILIIHGHLTEFFGGLDMFYNNRYRNIDCNMKR